MKSKVIIHIKANWKYIVFSIVLFVLTLSLVTLTNTDIGLNSYKLVNLVTDKYGFISLIMIILFSIYIHIANKINKEVDLSKAFLYIVIPIGILFCIVNPLGRVPDEDSHISRAYDISYGHFFSKQDENGAAVAEFNSRMREIVNFQNDSYEKYIEVLNKEDTGEKKISSFSNMALYSPICHTPQAFGIFITRLFGANIIVQLYAARVMNFIVAITLVYFAIKNIPFKKIVIFTIALLPINLNAFASLSADALTISSTLFFASYILYLKYDKNKEKLNRKDYMVLILSSIIVSMCKIVYLPLCLCLFLIPNSKFDSKKEKYIKTGILFGIVVILNLLWLRFASRFLIEYNAGVNSKEQVIFILTNPLKYCIIILRTLNINFQNYYLGIVGNGISHMSVNISSIYHFMLLILLTVLFLGNEDKEFDFDIFTRGIFILIFVGIIVLIFTSLYVQWTSVGKPIIEGVQARYFIPILFLIPLIFNNKTLVFNKIINYKYILLFMSYINLHAITYIMASYF